MPAMIRYLDHWATAAPDFRDEMQWSPKSVLIASDKVYLGGTGEVRWESNLLEGSPKALRPFHYAQQRYTLGLCSEGSSLFDQQKQLTSTSLWFC
ncbi:hypothetical protein TNCV_4820531 [Trichonephila clavipes]|nr:hypothetical protein TNCV_4820531 [Trichonephila clavipes]